MVNEVTLWVCDKCDTHPATFCRECFGCGEWMKPVKFTRHPIERKKMKKGNKIKKGDLVIVDAPLPYANMSLNGSLGKVLHVGEMITTVKLITGPSLGSDWQFNPAHIRLANKRVQLTAFGVSMRRFIARNLIKWAYCLDPFGGK